MKKLLSIVLAISMASLMAGCASTTTTETTDTATTTTATIDICQETDHDSCISEDGIDEALEGQWNLALQSVSASVGSIDNPFAGRTTSFDSDGTYTEDYSTEETDDVTYASITSSCDVAGILSGTWSAATELDLDSYDPNDSESVPTSINYLRITPDGGTPTVTCQATGDTASSNQASTPLGVGVATGTDYVEYTYTMDSEWTTLTIMQENEYSGSTNTYVFSR